MKTRSHTDRPHSQTQAVVLEFYEHFVGDDPFPVKFGPTPNTRLSVWYTNLARIFWMCTCIPKWSLWVKAFRT